MGLFNKAKKKEKVISDKDKKWHDKFNQYQYKHRNIYWKGLGLHDMEEYDPKFQRKREKYYELVDEYEENCKFSYIVGLEHTKGEKKLKKLLKKQEENWQYNWRYPINVTLAPEPKNEHDKNAIMVLSKYNPLTVNHDKIGYIPAEMAKKIKLKKPIEVKACMRIQKHLGKKWGKLYNYDHVNCCIALIQLIDYFK